jgi:hypothetical protein
MSSSKQSKASLLALIQGLIAGTQKHSPNGQFQLGNVTYSSASLLQVFQNLQTAITAQDVADASAKDALLATRDAETTAKPLITAYRRYLQTIYGKASQVLVDYGLTPAKAPKPLTVEAKAAKVKLNLATRKARGTVGPKKRLEIKGTVESAAEPVSVSPTAAPAKPTA